MKKSLSIFAIITLLFVIAAWFSVQHRSPETVMEKEPLFPQLADQIQQITSVEIKTGKNTVTLEKLGDKWVVKNRGGYPALVNRIKPLVIAISKLEIREAKTANPALYSRLQVEDVTSKKAKSRQVTLMDKDGNILASLLIGKERVNRSDGTVDSIYVRRAGEKQSYLVKGKVVLSDEPVEWMDNSLIDLASDRLKSITIEHGGDKTVRVSRKEKDDVDYVLQNIPEGYEVRSQTTVNSLASVVEDLQFNDVNSAKSFKWPDQTLTTVYETFDGLVMKVKSAKIDDQVWAEFSFDYKGEETSSGSEGKDNKSKKPSAKEQAEILGRKTSGWVYALPAYKGKMLRRSLDELIIEKGKKPDISTQKEAQNKPSVLPSGTSPEVLMKNGQGSPKSK